MLITDAQIQRIAQLARIETNASETAELQQQLSGIFTLIEAMQAVNTAGIEPMAHAQDVTQRLRDDRVTEPDQREALLANAPESEAGLYLVPKVIE